MAKPDTDSDDQHVSSLFKMQALGTSPWVDNITREWFHNGKLQSLIDSGVVGLTSNPAIFAAAISSTALYDDQILTLAKLNTPVSEIAINLAADDVGHAAQILTSVYEDTGHDDGWASLEVDPDLAFDPVSTLEAAKRLKRLVNKPNVMIKIPATKVGIGPIEDAIAEGISINVTLIFSIARYREVYGAYLRGAKRFLDKGHDPAHLRSVASFFVSRLDATLDPLLIERNRGDLIGKAALAQAKLAYSAFEEISASEAAQTLFTQGICPQRPLFASTSTKNPSYPKLLYVENLIGANTVNTMPLATVDEMLSNGTPRANSVREDLDGAAELLGPMFNKLGIDMVSVTEGLETDGVESFSKAWHGLIEVIEKKITNSP